MCLSDGQANGLSLNGHHSRCDNQNDNNNHDHEQKRSEMFVRQTLVGCVFEKGNENRNYRFHHGNFESGSSWKTEWKVQSSLVLVLFCNNVQVWCS